MTHFEQRIICVSCGLHAPFVHMRGNIRKHFSGTLLRFNTTGYQTCFQPITPILSRWKCLCLLYAISFSLICQEIHSKVPFLLFFYTGMHDCGWYQSYKSSNDHWMSLLYLVLIIKVNYNGQMPDINIRKMWHQIRYRKYNNLSYIYFCNEIDKFIGTIR